MNKFKTKSISCILASCIVLSNAAFCVDAASITAAPSSDFEYELTAEVVTEQTSSGGFNDLVKLTFDVTNNPGMSSIKIAFMLDYDTCSFAGQSISDDLIENSYLVIPTKNEADDLYVVDIITEMDTSWPHDRNDEFTYSLYLDVDDSALSTCEFSTAVIAYRSVTENINMDITSPVPNYTPDAGVEAGNETFSYNVGDVVKDGKINLDDAVAILNIVSYANDANYSRSVSNINNLINAKVAINEEDTWATMFPGLVLDNGYACAEIANADATDSFITQNDAQEVIDYYSDAGADLDVNEFINSEQDKVMVMFQSTGIQN